jgi:GT2 family glycosyltransferase
MNEFATIIVPTFRRQNLFLKCLNSLVKQDYGKGKYEVIAIHDGLNCDYDKQAINIAATRLKNFRFEKIVHGGVSRARNHGITLARGEFILMLDDDCETKEDWIKSFVTYMKKHPEVAAAGGTVLTKSPQTFIQRYIDFKNLLRRPVRTANGEIIALITASACFRKNIIDRVGGFREELSYSGGEDLDLSYRCRRLGKLSYCKEAIVYHHHRRSVKDLVKQHILYGRGVYRACKLNNINFSVLKFYDPTFWGLFKYFCYVLKRVFTVSLPEFRSKNLPFRLYLPYCYLDTVRKLAFMIGAASERIQQRKNLTKSQLSR